MIDCSNALLTHLIMHKVGSQQNEEDNILSKRLLNTTDADKQKLLKVIQKIINNTQSVSEFTHPVSLTHNSLFNLATELFSEEATFLKTSSDIVRYLFEISGHQTIKHGPIIIARIQNIKYADEISDALFIGKVESTSDFLKTELVEQSFRLFYDQGIQGKNIEKACLIFNYDYDTGFNVFSFEKVQSEYWSRDFLSIKAKQNAYTETRVLLNSVRDFAYGSTQIPLKSDRISLVHNAIDYLQNQDATLQIEESIQEMIADKKLRTEYRHFLNNYPQAEEFLQRGTIELDHTSLNKGVRQIRSVIKLDKNFHIYIHGDRSKIKHGVDENGRKYYQLFYDDEA